MAAANYPVKNHQRRRRRYRNFLNRLPTPANSPDVAEMFSDTQEREHEAATQRKAFVRLRLAGRAVLTPCVVEGMSIRDTASVLGIVEGTVKYRPSAHIIGGPHEYP